MPINHIALQEQLARFLQEEAQYFRNVGEQLAQAEQTLEHFSGDLERMQGIAEKSQSRIAIPTYECPMATFAPRECSINWNLVCADGSQIIPDPHDAPLFALVNIGIICMRGTQPAPIRPLIYSKLYQHNQLFLDHELISGDLVNLDRDVLEMQYLVENCQGLGKPIIALRDGLLELYHEPRTEKAFQERIATYHNFLQSLGAEEVILAGYIDKPRSQMLIELLRYCQAEEDGQKQFNLYFPDILDRQLFEGLLKSGERSAIFENRPPRTNNLAASLLTPFYFFYLNVSQNQKPCIVRVEIPEWVAFDNQKVNLLHAVLLEQCAIMGTKPYPYCLHRAHETALVSQEEKEELVKWIQTKHSQEGIPLEEKSYKLSAKELSDSRSKGARK